MLINLSDVLSEQHKTVDETVQFGDGYVSVQNRYISDCE